jgi:hypothetical protein
VSNDEGRSLTVSACCRLLVDALRAVRGAQLETEQLVAELLPYKDMAKAAIQALAEARRREQRLETRLRDVLEETRQLRLWLRRQRVRGAK